jgi:hypothetical protein
MQLSAGWVEGESIRCRYHGWKYGSEGRCQERPGELERDLPSNIRIPTYPATEYHGLIFAYLGSDDAPEFPMMPEFDGGGIFEATEYSRNCNFANFLDNQLDEVHIPFTHPIAFRAIPEVPRIELTRTDFAITAYTIRPKRDVRISEFLMPNITRLKLPSLYEGIEPADSVVWRVPVDEGRTISFGINRYQVPEGLKDSFLSFKSRFDALPPPDIDGLADAVLRGDFTLEEAKEQMGEHDPLYDVFLEDHVTMIGQGVTRSLESEVLGKADVGVIAVRDLWERHLEEFAQTGIPARSRPGAATATSGEVQASPGETRSADVSLA